MSYPTTTRQADLAVWLRRIAPTVFWVIAEDPLAPPIPENRTVGIIRIVSTDRLGNDGHFKTYNETTEKFTYEIYSTKLITFTIDVKSIDQSANYILQTIETFVNDPETIEYFASKELGYVENSTIRNLSALSSGRWRSRFQLDIKFNIEDSVFIVRDRIVEAPTEGDIHK